MLVRRRLCWLLLVVGCGGSSPEAKEPSVRNREPRDEASAATSERDPEPSQRGQRSARCEDGSCFACGDAVCLSGYYCLAAKAARGCAWVPGCATQVACGCVMEALRENTSCRCEEKEGGVFVACDGAKL